MARKLVIVESPAKARTLSKFLGSAYRVKACMGHVRDLPQTSLGVDVKNDFAPKYVTPRIKMKLVRELKEAASDVSSIYLATDPDREGEAISWHLIQAAKLDKDGVPIHRVAFHEITKEAVKQAFSHPRSIDMRLVNAQQGRRILDRLVGYKLSPLLWKKIRRGLSAGRVQSVALRMIVDREREIEDFVPTEYWTIEAELMKIARQARGISFRALLVGLADGTKLSINSQEEAERLIAELRVLNYIVSGVYTREVSRQPTPPFTTSTLQQEAWRKLHFTAKRTMAIAQQLYEGLPIGEEGVVGLITYMRTDSTNIAASALSEARDFISREFGSEFLPPQPRRFAQKAKFTQEAHEAIRPTRVHRKPEMLKPYLSADQFKLYELIWKRMVASQMAAALFDSTTVDVEAKSSADQGGYLFRATRSILKFPGFTILYTESKDEAEEDEKAKPPLPKLEKGDRLKLVDLSPEQHFTQPPPRYTEATLIKALEQEGIGRPSTYVPIISIIQERDYVQKMQGKFHAQELGVIVSDLLSTHFPTIVDLGFTAQLEGELDRIAQGKKEWVPVVRHFYTPFEKALNQAFLNIDKVEMVEPTDELCPNCGQPMVVKWGRYGKFLACRDYPQCKGTRRFLTRVGVACPECGGELVEKMSKRKRIFYGCANFPRCQFATSQKPIPQPCPECGGLLTLYGKKGVRCTKCQYKGGLSEMVGAKEAMPV